MIGDVIAAWLDVRTKPLRTFAAIAGMVAAVVAVVLVDAAGVLSRDANDTYLARQYGLPVTASIFSESGRPTAEQAARLEKTLRGNGIVALSPDTSLPANVSFGGASVHNGLRLLSPAYNQIRIVDLVAGAWPTETANSDVLHVVLSQGWAQEVLGLTDQQAIGQMLGYSTDLTVTYDVRTTPVKPMVVDAVVSTATNAFASGSSPIAVVTALPHPDLLGNAVSMSWVARVNPQDYGLLQEQVASVKDEQGRQVYRTTRADQGDQLAPVLAQQAVTARVVTVVALTIGGLGILGVGIAGVRERARDFGLRRALGASTRRIFGGVIVQTLLEVLLAAVIAMPLAAILLELFAREMVLETLPLPPSTSLPLSSAAQGLAGALLVGLVAGLLPAINAARLSVVQALRG
ncbi:MAG: ABC transporter permease [Chloroflexota bacterium]|nr:ABC transporter permease [Chloroflexota bacterium]